MSVHSNEASTASIMGLSTRYLRQGHGQPIVVLHGWGGSIESVHPIVQALSARCDVLALDLPGFGETEAPESAWGSADYAQFVADFMENQSIPRAVLIGHSHGGRTAIRLAADQPDRVSKLVLVDSAGLRPRRTLRHRLKLGIARLGKFAALHGGSIGSSLQQRLIRRTASPDYLNAGRLRPTFVRLVSEDLRELLPTIAAPTLLIWGGKDTATPLADAHVMERLIPNAGLVVFERAGHFSYADEPAAFGRVVRHFVTGNADP